MATTGMRSLLSHNHPHHPPPSSLISRFLCPHHLPRHQAPPSWKDASFIQPTSLPPSSSFLRITTLASSRHASSLSSSLPLKTCPSIPSSLGHSSRLSLSSSSLLQHPSASHRGTQSDAATVSDSSSLQSSSCRRTRSATASDFSSFASLTASRRGTQLAATTASDSARSKKTARPKKTRTQPRQSKSKEESTFNVPVILEESLDLNPDLEVLLDQLECDGPLAVKLAIEGMDDFAPTETVELSLLICDDAYICNLNKEWRGEDHPTDVLSFPQDQPPGVSSILLLGDVIISLDTAKRQAQERGHGVLDELRILLVHGLLHVLGYDHEEGPKAAAEMEKEELRILQGLGWNSKGLITASADGTSEKPFPPSTESEDHAVKSKGLWKRRPLFKVLLCDMDGTLLNSKSKITEKTAGALKEAIGRGVKVIVATGKTRPAVIMACQRVGLVGEKGVVSESSPGVFVQGLLVYGQDGKVVHSQRLSQDVCIKAFQYSLEQNQPLLGFSGDRIVTLFDHPLIEQLHTVYMEPKAEVAPSLDYLIKNFQIQKLLFADTVEKISKVVRPYWSDELGDLARVVQAQDDMLEIIPVGSSKGKGVAMLLDSMGVHPDDVMAIGDGENDIEMLELVGWGVAMGNGSPQTLAVADARVASNNEDGVVEALERFLLA